MLIKSIKLNEYILTSETFFVISLINLILFSLLTAYNSRFKFPLMQSALINLSCYMLFLYTILLYNEDLSTLKLTSFFNSVCYDYLSFISKTIIIFTSIICLMFIKDYIIKQKMNKVEYVIIILFSILGLLLLCSANDLLTVYLGMELQSLSFYLLAAYRKKSSYSVDAGLKYFILGSFSSSLFLFGSSFIYVAYGSINFDDFRLLSDFFLIDSNDLSVFYGIDCESLFTETEILDGGIAIIKNQSSEVKMQTLIENLQPHLTVSAKDLVNKIMCDYHFACDLVKTSSLVNLNEWEITKKVAVLSFSEIGFIFSNEYDQYFKELPSINLKDIKNCDTLLMFAEHICVREILSEILLDHYLNLLEYDVEGYENSVKQLKKLNPDIFEKQYDKGESFRFQYFVIIGLLLIFFSLFFKLSLAPFHLWSPDVYENSPTSSSFFFAVVPKISIFVVLVRLVYSSFFFAFDWIQELLLLVSLLSIMSGSLGGLYQRKIKSLLAYSSISHMGYLMIAFASASIEGLQMLFCYLIVYTITGLCIWSVIILIRLKKTDKIKQNKDLADLVLLCKSNYVLALILMSSLFSIAGIPPLVGFIVKMNIFLVAIENKFYIVSIISVLFSVVSTFFYLRLIKVMYFEPLLVGRLYYPIESFKVFVIVLLFFSLIFFFINPTLLYLLSYKISYLFI